MNVLTAREIDINKWDLSAFVESCEITYLPSRILNCRMNEMKRRGGLVHPDHLHNRG